MPRSFQTRLQRPGYTKQQIKSEAATSARVVCSYSAEPAQEPSPGWSARLIHVEPRSDHFSAALTSSTASIGIIIPPSIPMIIYGAVAGVSVGALFIAGIIPGILVGLGQGVTSFGGVTPWITRNNTFEFLDNLSIVRGRHSIKMGGEARRDRYNQYGNQKATGEFIFDGQSTFDPANRNATGFIFADYMLGLPAQSARVVGMANGMLRRSSFSGYLQDDWKITSRLTLSLGLRYESGIAWHDKYRAIVNAQVTNPGVDANGIVANAPPPVVPLEPLSLAAPTAAWP